MTIFIIIFIIAFYLIATYQPNTNINKMLGDLDEINEAHNITFYKNHTEAPEKPLEVIIKSGGIDVSKLPEWTEEYKQFEFRPQNFQQFIGQSQAKEDAKTLIKQAQRDMKAHFFMTSPPGCGKTTFVNLFGNELNATVIERTGNDITEDNLPNIFHQLYLSETKHNILFIDEIDSMKPELIKSMNIAIEQFKLGGKKLRPFIFACATIDKAKIIQTNPDFLDRISTHIRFVPYNAENIKEILIQITNQLYQEDNIEENIFDIIGKNCKFNPRIAGGLLEKYIVEKDIKKVLYNRRIVKDGLTEVDINILTALEILKTAGSKALASKVGLQEKEYLREFEPYLVNYGYIDRTQRGRKVGDKGLELLTDLKQEV